MNDAADPIVQDETTEAAAELLAKLRPSDERWGPDPTVWAFRGHADAENWELLPTAAREKPWKCFAWNSGRHPVHDPTCRQFDHEFLEAELVWTFYRELDAAGLPVPEADHAVRTAASNRRGFLQMKEDGGWPARRLCPLLALAQHHGIPTRLLDWTRRATRIRLG